MSMEQAFAVATEFRFDVGEALLNTQALQGAVDDLSKSANSALGSLSYLASGLVAHLGLGSGGLLTLLSRAVQVSEAFNQSALQFANNISSNISVLSGDIGNFNDRLETSKVLLGDIGATANRFGLDKNQLASITQLIATPLANAGKLGKNYGGAINMGKNLLLGSEAVGLHPQVASESLYRALTEHMPLHGALFARMLNTPAFKSGGVRTQQQLMTMTQDKKLDLLSKALEQLAGDAGFLSERLMHIGVQFTMLKNKVMEVLTPIGDAIVKPIVQILSQVNDYLGSHGKEIGDNVAKFIGNIFSDPQKLFVNLMQLKNLKSDLKKSMDIAGILFLFGSLGSLVKPLKPIAAMVEKFLGIKEGMGFLAILRSDSGIIAKVFGLLRSAFADFIPVTAALLFFFQIISRAMAIAKIKDIIHEFQLIPKAIALFVRLKVALENILMPLTMSMDYLANMISWLFRSTIVYEAMIDVLTGFVVVAEWLGNTVLMLTSAFSGIVGVIMGFVFDLMSLKNPFSSVLQNYKDGYKMIDPNSFGDMNKAVVNQVTNIGKVEANFNMREQLEPDRVAFAVTTHLKKLVSNPRQGRGQSTDSSFANPNFAGAR